MTDLITLQQYKDAKGLTKTDQDVVLAGLITNCSAIIQRYLDKSFFTEEEEVTEVISLDYPASEIYLENYPIDAVTEVTQIDPTYYDSTVHFPAEEAVDYGVDLENGRLVAIGGKWPCGFNAVSVTYTLGGTSASSEIPPELKQVTIDLVTYYLKEEYKDSKSMRGATINNNTGTGNSNTLSTDFPPHIQRVLDLFK